jgi:hypothetical protein
MRTRGLVIFDAFNTLVTETDVASDSDFTECEVGELYIR